MCFKKQFSILIKDSTCISSRTSIGIIKEGPGWLNELGIWIT
jgi:hypothetical protein